MARLNLLLGIAGLNYLSAANQGCMTVIISNTVLISHLLDWKLTSGEEAKL
ncbi:hypothetical protein SB775_02355 [Peribacillus sp. SIMBA_075]|uniref:hypothetical protein n=1 Tax=Peribacillus sp. SIMBA_075 TaxID=3085813 RepID=UPI003978418E